MSTYAIGDVQGCLDPLKALLRTIDFDPAADTLWFCGDLVNRGPQSLETLRFVRDLGDNAITVLGNHDLHLIATALGVRNKIDPTLVPILEAPDREALLDWLRHRPMLHHDAELGFTLVHAGLPPQWDIALAQACAGEVEVVLRDDSHADWFTVMYGDEPDKWQDSLEGFGRLRFITNALTRIRFCTAEGRMHLDYKGGIHGHPKGTLPWFDIPGRASEGTRILFGHWAALELSPEKQRKHGAFHLDTGCVWGGALTAMRLEDQAYFSQPCS